MGITYEGCGISPQTVTGDRFTRRENLMEKSEMSGTDTPAIRQAIHDPQAALRARPREKVKRTATKRWSAEEPR